jgi:protein ImuA
MPPDPDRHLVIARLREEIRRIERSPARREGRVASGLAGVDAVLPGGGFPRGALSELSGGPASGKTAVALSLVAALGPQELAAWVDGRGELYPPAAAARGVDLARLLVVRPPGPSAGRAEGPGADGVRVALWAAEALLASGAFAAVVVDLPEATRLRGADAAARRLQAAAERGGAVGLWLSPGLALRSEGAGLRIPAAVRIELAIEASGRPPGAPGDVRIIARPLRGDAPSGGTRVA